MSTILIDRLRKENRKLKAQVKDQSDLVQQNLKLRRDMVNIGKVAEFTLNDFAQTITHALVGQEILTDVMRKLVSRERKPGETMKWFNEVWTPRHEILAQLEQDHGEEKARQMIREILGVEDLDGVFKEVDQFVSSEIARYVKQIHEALDQE